MSALPRDRVPRPRARRRLAPRLATLLIRLVVLGAPLTASASPPRTTTPT